ncbi:3-dehydroquinate synthase [Aliidiomarina sp. Khilg15.8]
MQQITVQLGTRSYPIHIGSAQLHQIEPLLTQQLSHQVFIISNTTVAPLYLETLCTGLGKRQVVSFCVPDGEQYKTLSTYQQVMDALVESGFGRDCTVIALGGGVVGDLAGFVAATYQRGVNFIQIPTTLLAQVDSSVGGKTAVNHAQGKNLVGAFHQPGAVVIDIDCLQTLPTREFHAGLAEVIKYGVMADADFFAWLEREMPALLAQDADALTYAVKRSCELKAKVVAADEREQGQRALLNLGHTFGHAIETAQGYGSWLHGEAVAAGTAIAADVACAQKLIDEPTYQRIVALLQAANLPVCAPAMDWATWQQLMGRDKKVKAGQIRFVLPTALGAAALFTDIPEARLQKAVAADRR